MSSNNVIPFPAPASAHRAPHRPVLVPFPAPVVVAPPPAARLTLAGRLRRFAKGLSIVFRSF